MSKFLVQTRLPETDGRQMWGYKLFAYVQKEVCATYYRMGDYGELIFLEDGSESMPVMTFAPDVWAWVEEVEEDA